MQAPQESKKKQEILLVYNCTSLLRDDIEMKEEGKEFKLQRKAGIGSNPSSSSTECK